MNTIDSYPLTEASGPERLLRNIHDFVMAYQETDAKLFAWMVCDAANALYQHPDYEGSDEERCVYKKMSKQWEMLAKLPR